MQLPDLVLERRAKDWPEARRKTALGQHRAFDDEGVGVPERKTAGTSSVVILEYELRSRLRKGTQPAAQSPLSLCTSCVSWERASVLRAETRPGAVSSSPLCWQPMCGRVQRDLPPHERVAFCLQIKAHDENDLGEGRRRTRRKKRMKRRKEEREESLSLLCQYWAH